MTEMKKHIYDESNGLWYEHIGDYYIPVLTLSSEEQRPIGKRGWMNHRNYLKEHRPILFNDLVLSGQLWTYLADLNEQMKASEGVTEKLKADNQMAWVGVMNSIRSWAEDVKGLIYGEAVA